LFGKRLSLESNKRSIEMDKKYIVLSACLHVAIFLLVPKQVDQDGKQEYPITIQIGVVGEKEEVGSIAEKVEGPADKEGRWYGGIGITQNAETGAIETMVNGYPAANAGLRLGDRIQTVTENGVEADIRGEPGTEIVILVYRTSTGEHLMFKVMRDKIYYND